MPRACDVRAFHAPVGNPCSRCGKPASWHPGPKTLAKKRERDRLRKKRKANRLIIGIDGEGFDLPSGKHVYTYLCAADENGRILADAYEPEGLSFEQCAEVLLSLPRYSLKVGFMFSYDTTKIIEDLPPAKRYRIMRPEYQRKRVCKSCKTSWLGIEGLKCPDCGTVSKHTFTDYVRFEQWGLKWFAGSLTIAERKKKGYGYKNSVQIWDVFKFFQTSFVEALRDWSVGTDEQIARIEAMKDQRGSFDIVDPERIRKYCQEECVLLAQMMRKVITAHIDAGIPLKRYEGAGSSAGALLKKHHVNEYRGPAHYELDSDLAHAIESAYFGGRFENSYMGSVSSVVYASDIASAYPYALTFSPCLACGSWRYEKDALTVAQSAVRLVQFRVKSLPTKKRKALAWAPLPFRDSDGSITYPLNFIGWAWGAEIDAALEHWPGLIEVFGAWVYETKCNHKPFGFMPSVYRQRCALGKEKAKPFKLGMNASYGRTAQTVGDDPPFRSLAWAGLCTATTRAMLLHAIGAARNRWNVLGLATDAIFSTEKIKLANPVDTGTFDLPKPLGCWEAKPPTNAAYFIKPGLYFAADVSEPKEMRARGIGRREFYRYRRELIKAIEAWDRVDFEAGIEVTSRRFYGAKTSILCQSNCFDCDDAWPGLKLCKNCGNPGRSRFAFLRTLEGKVAYGRWAERKIRVRFDPRPKRESVDRKTGRLHIRDAEGRTSTPYQKGSTTPEGFASRALRELLIEQPDIDTRSYTDDREE